MKYIKTLVAALFAALLVSTAVAAEPTERWTFSLAGAGATAVDSKSSTFGTELSLGYNTKFLLPVELGVRQAISYSSDEGNLVFGTRVYSDFTVLKVGKNLDFFAGASGGAGYGDTAVTWVAGPEVGARLFLKRDVFVFGRVQYDFDLNNRTALDQTGSDKVRYALGISVRF
jgi:hypothetical protein